MKNNLEHLIEKQGIGVLDLLSRIKKATGRKMNWHTLAAAREGRPVNTRTHESIGAALGVEVRIEYGEVSEDTIFTKPQAEPSEAWKIKVLVAIAQALGLPSGIVKQKQKPQK